MKHTKTEFFIEFEEIIAVRQNNQTADTENETDEKKISKTVIEICPHCGEAIFETQKINPFGEKKL